MAHYREDIARIDLETGTVFRNFMARSLGEGDISEDRFGVEAYRNGVPEQLGSASCIGYFIRSTGDTVVISGGTVSGNRAYITLPQACYAYEGNFSLAIKLVGGNVTGTLRIVDGTVARTTTGTVIDPGSVVPDLTTLLAQIERLEAANDTAESFFPAAGGTAGQLLSKTASGTAWTNAPEDIFVATYNVTTFAQVQAAWQAGKIIRVKLTYADRPAMDLLCEESTNYFRFTKYTDDLGTDSDIGLYEIMVQSNNAWSLGYVSPAQKKLISGTNIKTINGESLLGSGNIDVSGGGGSGAVNSVNGKTGTVVLSASDVGAQPTLVSGTNIKTVNNQSLLGSGNIVIQGGGGEPEIFWAEYGVTPYADIIAAVTAGKQVLLAFEDDNGVFIFSPSDFVNGLIAFTRTSAGQDYGTSLYWITVTSGNVWDTGYYNMENRGKITISGVEKTASSHTLSWTENGTTHSYEVVTV